MLKTMNTSATLYACPVCGQTLHRHGRTLRCSNQHSFDRHKKGYINLLLSQHKRSKQPGDNADMVQGRREFLRAGHYQPFANAITILAKQTLDHKAQHSTLADIHTTSILDAGCGEGFYTEQLEQAIEGSLVYGLDISKPAITAAANNKTIEWSVASSHRLPFIDESFSMIVSIFSRVEPVAFLRALQAGGYVIYAGPGDRHLHNLRHILYDEVNEYSTDKHHHYFSEGFQLISEESLQVPIHLSNNKSIKQLVSMTPHAHRLSRSGRERLENTHQLNDVGDFKLYVYQKV